MRRSEFARAVTDEFGESFGSSLLDDLALADAGGCTASEALAAGMPPREVWLALCAATDVPAERRYGVGQLDPKR